MLNKLKINKVLWNITTITTLIAALCGILSPHSYDNVFAKEFLPGALPQDLLTAFLCFITLHLINRAKEKDVKIHVVIIGIMGSFFYLYGIFTIERVYNQFYLLYTAIFGLSSWTLVYNLISLNTSQIKSVTLDQRIAKLSSFFGTAIAILFSFLWISALIPLMQKNDRIDYLYSIYILDLCFIMPAFVITAILTLKRKIIGLLLLPAVYIVGFFVIFPLSLAEIARPYYNQTTNVPTLMMSLIFSVFMLLTGFLQLSKMRIQ